MHSRNSSSRSAFYRARQREEVARSWFEQMSLSRWISSTASIHTWALRVFVDLDVDCRQPNMSTNLNMTSLFPRNDIIFDLRVSLLCSNGLGRHTLSCTMHTSHSTKLDKRSTQHSTQSRHTTSRLTPHSHDPFKPSRVFHFRVAVSVVVIVVVVHGHGRNVLLANALEHYERHACTKNR